MTDDEALADIKAFTEESKKIMDAVHEVWTILINTKTDVSDSLAAISISNTEVVDCVRKHCNVPNLAKERKGEIINAFRAAVDESDGPNTCAMWRFAHYLHHIVYDVDFKV